MEPTHPKTKKGVTHLARKGLVAFRGLKPYAKRHSSLFFRGAFAATGVVLARLSLPWPLRQVTDQWTRAEGASKPELLGFLPPNADLSFVMGSIFLFLLLMLGYFDYRERLHFSRFAGAMTRDLKADLLRVAAGLSQRERTAPTSDWVNRLIGDTARLKNGLQGFLVHVAISGLVFAGVTLILLKMNSRLGLIFAAAGVATVLLTVWGAAKTFKKTLKNRKKEGRLANRIQDILETGDPEIGLEEPHESSGYPRAKLTRIQGIVTWSTHAILGGAVLAALWVGSGSVERGEMEPGDMVVFMMYTLMMRGPIVRLARQGCKSGKIFASAYRLVQIFREAGEQGPRPASDARDTAPSHQKEAPSRIRNNDHTPATAFPENGSCRAERPNEENVHDRRS